MWSLSTLRIRGRFKHQSFKDSVARCAHQSLFSWMGYLHQEVLKLKAGSSNLDIYIYFFSLVGFSEMGTKVQLSRVT